MAKESPEIILAGIKLSRQLATPLYLQLYEQLRAMILAGRLRPGDRLPPGRNLAKELGVARVIVSQAYEQLVMEGYVTGKTGAGTFVAEKLPDHLLNATRNGQVPSKATAPPVKPLAARPAENAQTGSRIEAVPFQVGMPALDQFPYKLWQQSGNQVLKNFKQAHLGYEDTLGCWNLRKAIAAYLRIARAVTCEAEQVIVVTGSQQGLNLVVECLLNKGDKVWMEDPGYHGARIAFTNAGVIPCPIPIEADGLNVAHGVQHFPDAKLAYVTPSHQFPMGCTLSHGKREQLLDWARQQQSWILEDDYDSEFRYEGRPLPSLQGMDTGGRVIYSGTFSKVLFPGLRLAYIVLPTVQMVNEFKRVKDNQDRQSPVMEQLILCDFMEGGYFLRHIRKMRLLYAERQQQLLHLLQTHLKDQLRVSVAPSGMHVLCWLPEDIDMTKFKEAIQKERLAIAFVSYFTIQYKLSPAIMLGFTAYTKYKMKVGVEKLVLCLREACP
ncbi:PLP-dependent aminotransferase family protein [Paraflavitalea soli]|uniref:PLP-dependent aminotransferase family protein n=1 Tax=Paraflavitalea soli TaxID=2315862 RepID=A0A3B7MTF8_9BACT|nr:PLP-dependent aminotransferase family protein [Paraflavitalea soli]AXY76340.1 PLP-dependent aminotransferase family protein [Paraflavitalea soli]